MLSEIITFFNSLIIVNDILSKIIIFYIPNKFYDQKIIFFLYRTHDTYDN